MILLDGIKRREFAPRHKRWHYHMHVFCNLQHRLNQRF